jgi:uncharacterized membrane-anchored protein
MDRRMTGLSSRSLRYWAALCVASVAGACLGDWLAHDLGLGHWRGAIALAVLLGAVLLAGSRLPVLGPACFWIAVLLIRAGATNLADLADHDWRLSAPALAAGLGVALLVCVSRPGAALRNASVPGTGVAFWLGLFLAGAIGTVIGDAASHRFGLAAASALLSLALALLFALRLLERGRGRGGWLVIVGARSAGTSLGDWLADTGGLGLGIPLATGLSCLALVAVVATPSRR